MTDLSFFLAGHPPGPNQTVRWHWGRRAKERRVWRDASAWGARAAYGRSSMAGHHRPVEVAVTFHFRVTRTRDRDNLVASLKPVLDGLVDAGILKDDSPTWLRSLVVREQVAPTERLGITVEVSELRASRSEV
jgi:crossover junction endodeoxyribonuclease RusA